jgi:diacylglycerol O-acyltransferase / wax synthase
MAQGHLDRLNAVDAGFLHQEDGGNAHMHIGGIAVFDGPAPDYDEFLAFVASRLHLMPRYRQKIVTMPLQTGRPLWVEDPTFNLGYHIRTTALPSPGGEEQLLQLAARIASQRLDRRKPLWELWLVEGLEGGRIALIAKTHHALVDGVSGVEMFTALFDLTPETTDRGAPASWEPQPTPSAIGLLSAGATDSARKLSGVARGSLRALGSPRTLAGRAVDVGLGLGTVAWQFIDRAPALPLNRPPGPHRRYAVVRQDLEDLKTVRKAFGGTINDVVVSVVTGALARFLTARGIDVSNLHPRACVPVSMRGASSGGLGNEIVIMVAPLPVSISDPVERLRVVSASMDGLKKSKQALGAKAITTAEEFAPPTLLAQASRLGMSSWLYNLMVTNVPGPQFPIYMLGRQLREVFPIAFLAPSHTLVVAVMSYLGTVGFGLLADFDAVPDLDVFASELDSALSELVSLAREELAGSSG